MKPVWLVKIISLFDEVEVFKRVANEELILLFVDGIIVGYVGVVGTIGEPVWLVKIISLFGEVEVFKRVADEELMLVFVDGTIVGGVGVVGTIFGALE